MITKDSKNYDLSFQEVDDLISAADSKVINEKNELLGLHRGMKSRHLAVISLSGAIGTGLFVNSGATLSLTGPAPMLIGYLVFSIVVFFIMNILAEMASFLSFSKNGSGAAIFINDYLSHDLGFTLGYNYLYIGVIYVAAEISVIPALFDYFCNVNAAVWISVFLALILVLNLSPVKWYGELEFWFGSIKLVTIVGLIILGIVIFFGGAPNHDRLGFRYWKNGKAFKEYLVGGDTGKFLSVWTAIIKTGFSFTSSPELVVAGAAEVERPRRNIRKAANSFVYRLIIFYVISSIVIGCIVDSNNDQLYGSSDTSSGSPFVLGIKNAGIPVLNQIVNAVFITSAASSANSWVYFSSRALFSLSRRGLAPKIFSKTNRHQIPLISVLSCWSIGGLAYLNVSSSSAQVFSWLSNITTISGFISWIFVGFAYLRWRKAIEYHELSDRVPYRTPFQPYGTYFVIFFVAVLGITNGYAVFFNFNISDFFAAYLTIIFVSVLYIGRRLYTYMKGERSWITPIEEISFDGLDQFEAENEAYPELIPRNFAEKVLYIII